MNTHDHRSTRLRSAGVMTAGLLVAVLAACGAGGADGGSGAAEPTAPTSASEPTPSVSEEGQMPDESTPYLDPSMGTSDTTGTMTITGTVESGVESGCLVLTHEGTVYGVFGSFDADVVRPGAEVTLHGHVEADMMSFCQQGTPFVVEEAESAG